MNKVLEKPTENDPSACWCGAFEYTIDFQNNQYCEEITTETQEESFKLSEQPESNYHK